MSPALRVKVIPDFIYRTILANKLNVVDIETYSLIRRYLSMEDLGLWEVANEGICLSGNPNNKVTLSTCPLFDIDKLSSEEAREYGTFIRPLSGANDNIAAVTAILSSPSSLLSARDSTYSFIQTQTFMAVIIYAGFITEMQDKAKYTTFVKKYLEQCNVMASENEVSQLPLFREYLTLL